MPSAIQYAQQIVFRVIALGLMFAAGGAFGGMVGAIVEEAALLSEGMWYGIAVGGVWAVAHYLDDLASWSRKNNQ